MGLIVTVTANAALDRTIYVDELHRGNRHRVGSEHVQAGGKGVNVSRVLAGLGASIRTVVVLGGETGRAIRRDLDASGLNPLEVAAPGESRTCLEVLETRSRRVTQLHGRGVTATEETVQALAEAVDALMEGASWLALCGSLPDGCPPDTYSRLTQIARLRGVRVAIDASGPALRSAWSEGPDLLRINREEAIEAIGESMQQFPPAETPGTARLSVVSDGPESVWVWDSAGRTWLAKPPSVQERNAIGCGDAMLAGLLLALGTAPLESALRFATSLASASAESDRAGLVDRSRAEALSSEVLIMHG